MPSYCQMSRCLSLTTPAKPYHEIQLAGADLMSDGTGQCLRFRQNILAN